MNRALPRTDEELRRLGQIEAALRQSEERFRTAVESMLDCFGTYSAVRDDGGRIVDFRIDYVNAAACESNLMRREEQVGRLLCEILPAHRESGLFEEYCRVIETGEPLIRETVVYEDDYRGRHLTRSFDIRAAKLGDGFIAVWRDITERKRAEELLKKSDRRKDEFLATLAHELRNPLAPIRNAVQVMQQLGIRDAQFQQMRDVVDRQSDQLSRLVDDLLDISRIGLGKIALRKEPLDLRTIVERAVEISRPWIDEGGHRLTVSLPSEPLPLDGDRTRLVQIVSNLLNNAAKYMEQDGSIRLIAEARGGEARIRVEDDGIGIPAEILPQVFDLFAQADETRDRARGGLGIGLALVRSLVELHGGTVRADSAGPGQGSVFTLSLPLRSELPEPADTGERQELTTRLRILVVDDNVDSAESMALLLGLGGQEVRTAHDGPGAIETAGAFRPHAVLLDIGLPGMTGYEVARVLREQPGMERAVLIALTGYGQDEDRRKALEAGFDHHMLKPIDFGALKALINSLVPS